MNTITALVVICLVTLATCQTETYTDRFDNINLDEILANKRLLTAYIKCLLDTGRCTAEGREMKLHLTEAIQNGCGNCTEKQKAGSKRVIQHLIKNENASWLLLVEKYDPTRVYSKMYEDELALAASSR